MSLMTPSKSGLTNILFVESNVDGTVGGSYLSLFFLVTGLDRQRYHPIVQFACEHSLVSKFTTAGIDTRVAHPAQPMLTHSAFLRPFARIANFLRANVRWIRAASNGARLLRREHIGLLHLNNS